jgi:cysteine dioxygenase
MREIAELVEALTALGDQQLHGSQVGELLQNVRPSLLEGLSWRRQGYTRNLVHREPRFEVLILCWRAGASTPVHDHDGQECWFQPLAGSFDLEDFSPALQPAGCRERVRTLDHQPGAAQIHRVRVSSGEPAAISLHVYAGPIEGCRVYDLESGRWRWMRLRYDAVVARPLQPRAAPALNTE